MGTFALHSHPDSARLQAFAWHSVAAEVPAQGPSLPHVLRSCTCINQHRQRSLMSTCGFPSRPVHLRLGMLKNGAMCLRVAAQVLSVWKLLKIPSPRGSFFESICHRQHMVGMSK